MIWEDYEKIKSYLEEEAGMVPRGGVGKLLRDRVLEGLSISNLTQIWDFLEMRGVICDDVLEVSKGKYSLRVLHSNINYLDGKIIESFVNMGREQNAN